MSSNKPKAGTAYIWALLESGGLSVLALVTLLILARLIGPKDFGIAALALGTIQILTIMVEMLLHDAIVQRHDLDNRHNDTAFWVSVGVGIALATGCALGAASFARLFDEPALAPILAVTGLSLIFSGIGCVPIALLRRNGDFKPLALRSLYGRLGGAIIGISMALLGAGVWSLVVQHLITVAVGTVLVWPAISWRPSRRFSGKALGGLLSFGVFSIGTRIVWALSVRLFTLLCGLFFGVTAAGYLNIAQRVVDTLYDVIAGAASQVTLSHFSRKQHETAALMQAYRKAIELTAISALPVFAGIAICAPSIIAVFLGEAWLPAAPLTRLLAAAAAIQFLFLFAHVALTAAGQPAGVFVVSLIGFVVVFGGLAIVRPDDVFGATIIWISRVIITGPLLLYIAWRSFGALALEPFKVCLAPLAATALMTVILVMAERYAMVGERPIVMLMVIVPLGVVLYATAVGIMSRGAVRRFFEFIAAGLRGLRTS